MNRFLRRRRRAQRTVDVDAIIRRRPVPAALLAALADERIAQHRAA